MASSFINSHNRHDQDFFHHLASSCLDEVDISIDQSASGWLKNRQDEDDDDDGDDDDDCDADNDCDDAEGKGLTISSNLR